MNRLKLTLIALLSAALVVTSLPLQAFAQSQTDFKPFLTTTRMYAKNGNSDEYVIKAPYEIFTRDDINFPQRAEYRASFDKALKDGDWIVTQYTTTTGTSAMVNLYWTETASTKAKLHYDNGRYMFNVWPETWKRIDLHTFENGKPYVLRHTSSFSTISLSRPADSGFSVRTILATPTYTKDNSMEGHDVVIPQTADDREQVVFPLFIKSSPSSEPNKMTLMAHIDEKSFKRENGDDVPLPKLFSIQLFSHDKKEIEPKIKGDLLNANMWENVPYGVYRFVAIGYYVGDDYNKYTPRPTVVDVKVDDVSFTYSYLPEHAKYCFYRSGISKDAVTNFSTDPNTGSWISPGAQPVRCMDQAPWEKSLDSEFYVGYDFDALPDCNTLDLACHISRFFNMITKWIFSAITFLFIPNADFLKAQWNQFLDSFFRAFGFLGEPFKVIVRVFNFIVSDKGAGYNCALPPLTVFGSTATIELCAWRSQLPDVWRFMQIIIQGGIALSFLWVLYDLVMRMFGVYTGASSESASDDSDVQEVRWHDDRTGEKGGWERRRR